MPSPKAISEWPKPPERLVEVSHKYNERSSAPNTRLSLKKISICVRDELDDDDIVFVYSQHPYYIVTLHLSGGP